MKVHEYQAKEILARYGVAIPKSKMITVPEDARAIAEELGGVVVIKAQVHAGGRGKAGGVKLAKNPDEAVQLAAADPRHEAGVEADRAGGDAGPQGAGRAGRRTSPGSSTSGSSSTARSDCPC